MKKFALIFALLFGALTHAQPDYLGMLVASMCAKNTLTDPSYPKNACIYAVGGSQDQVIGLHSTSGSGFFLIRSIEGSKIKATSALVDRTQRGFRFSSALEEPVVEFQKNGYELSGPFFKGKLEFVIFSP